MGSARRHDPAGPLNVSLLFLAVRHGTKLLTWHRLPTLPWSRKWSGWRRPPGQHEGLLRTNPDLKGLYVAGGGIAGALAAIRTEGRSGAIVTLGYDLMETTKAGLLDGSLTFRLSHPLDAIACATVAAKHRAAKAMPEGGNHSVFVPFDL